MNQFLKDIIGNIATLFPYNILSVANTPPLIGLYHTIEDHQPWYIADYYVKTEKQFRKELEFIALKYKPVELNKIIDKGNKDKSIIHLTFDDGLKTNHDIIAPILKEMGIPATFFINPGFISNNDIFHKFLYELAIKKDPNLPVKFKSYKMKKELLNHLEKQGLNMSMIKKELPVYMNEKEIHNLIDMGFTIGAHSLDHPEFYILSEQEQYDQVKKSMQAINKIFSPKIKSFAFPYTDFGVANNLMNRIFEEKIVDCTFGTAGLKHDKHPKHFQRIPFEKKKYVHAKNIMKFEFLYYRLKSVIGKNTVKRDD